MSHTIAETPTIVPRQGRTRTGVKESVGKRDLSEAFVIDCLSLCDAEQIVTAEWPRAHAFYTPTPQAHSPLLFTESVRQALAVSCHTAHGIPMDHRLGWEYLRSDVDADALRITQRPTTVRLRVVHSAIKRRRLGSVHLVAHVEGTADGAYVGSAEVHYSAHPGVIYDRLRGPRADSRTVFPRFSAPTPAVSPERVGRGSVRDVVLSPTGEADRWRIRVDTSHSVLYDHPHDHIPGMVLLEAASQAAQASLDVPATPVGFDTTFDRYVEFDAACVLTTAPLGPDLHGRPRVRIDAHQRERRVFGTVVTLAPAGTR
ncbi:MULTISPECIES: ScbA/BarX family gamma-butyrolactone biosynthesis protein [unclassified Streptomyces]|uniref:ScbA/BarX family gamma-butyrolactone biosynthesis protein n=1 Tax=unclassified Streptomyces TaxID=2593676 RepID=UPI0033BE618A